MLNKKGILFWLFLENKEDNIMNFSLKQIIKNNFGMYKICMLLIEKYNKIRWEMAMKNGGGTSVFFNIKRV